VLRRFAEDHDDAGITMIECIIALVIISTVLLAGVLEINVALTTSNQQRYRIEATNLAVATLEQVQQEAAAGTINPVQTTYPPQNVASQTFFVSTQYTVEQQNNGLVTSICTSTLSTDSSEIWQVSATVTWNGMQGQQPLTETTEVAPGAASAQQLADGELAIEVVGLTGTPLTTPVNFSVTPVAVGGGETVYPGAPIPSGLNTGNDGCGIVTDLSTDPDWNYVVTLTQNTGWVSAGELSDANSDPATATLSVSAGQVSRLSTPFQVALGANTTPTLQPVTYSCPGAPVPSCYSATFAPDASLPVTFANPSLPNGQYTFGSGSSAVPAELLYPFANGYSVFAGDMSQSNPGYVPLIPPGNTTQLYSGSPSPSPVSLSVTSQQSASIKVPVYDLSLKVSGAIAGASLTATEQGGSSLAYTLNPPNLVSGLSDTGMPLGQFLLSASNGLAGTPYVWITPSGVYQSSTQMSKPSDGTLVVGHFAVTEQ